MAEYYTFTEISTIHSIREDNCLGGRPVTNLQWVRPMQLEGRARNAAILDGDKEATMLCKANHPEISWPQKDSAVATESLRSLDPGDTLLLVTAQNVFEVLIGKKE
jgi:hypothetical protein